MTGNVTCKGSLQQPIWLKLLVASNCDDCWLIEIEQCHLRKAEHKRRDLISYLIEETDREHEYKMELKEMTIMVKKSQKEEKMTNTN